MKPFNLTCFGVGDGAACGDRNHSSHLYAFDGCSLLVDCGEPISRSYKASGLSCELVDRILLSHLHFDHVGGLFMLLQGLWLEGRTKELPVHVPAAGIEPIQTMLRTGYLYEELLDFRLRFVALEKTPSFNVNGVKVSLFPTTHLDGFRQKFQKRYGGDFHAYSFLFESGELRVGHSADIGKVEDLEPLLAGPLDLLVCELAHVEPAVLFGYLAGKAVKRIAFVHVGRPHWRKLPEIEALAARMLPGIEVIFPRDQAVICL